MSIIAKIIKKTKEGFWKILWQELRWIAQFVREYRRGIILYVVLSLVSMGLGLSLSYRTKGFVDALLDRNWSHVWSIAVYYVAVGMINVSIVMLDQGVASLVSTKVRADMSVLVYNRVMCADWEMITRYHSGDLITRLQEDVNALSQSMTGWLPSAVIQMLQALISAAIIIYYDPSMICVLLIAAPIILVGSQIFLKKLYESNTKQRENESRIVSLYKESFQHMQSIKSFGLESDFKDKMQIVQEKRRSIDLEVNKYSVMSWGTMYVSGQAAALVCLGWEIYHVYTGAVSLGTMALLILLASKIASSFKSFIQLVPTAIHAISSSQRVRELLELDMEEAVDDQSMEPLCREAVECGAAICMSNVCFAYKDQKPVLRDVSFAVNAGEIVAFVGPSGEGKTTLLRILLGLVKAQGDYRITTEHNACAISPAVRKLMAYVPQGNTILNGTIAENLRMLNPTASDDEVIDALKEACAYPFVEKLPEGINHRIGESGNGFSEGQNQRLAIARALMSRAPIILLDEATSALDVATERKVLANIVKAGKNKTCIITTHRPSVLSMCDRVYRIAGGHVTEIHDDEIAELQNEF